MGLVERRQRELKQREELILLEARRLFLADGYFGLSMDKLAEAVEYSKPTIYSHFSTKEDLLLAVCNESLRQRVDLFIRASGFNGKSRERMTAIGMADLVFVHAYRQHYEVEKLMKSTSLWDKSSDTRREDHARLDQLCMNTMGGIVGSAFAEEALDPKTSDPRAICCGLRDMSIGAHMLLGFKQRSDEEKEWVYKTLRMNQMRFLDGWGWKPLTAEWNYGETMKRILEEVFPEEKALLPVYLTKF